MDNILIKWDVKKIIILKNAYPNETGFSHSNVKYMKQWYSFYYRRLGKSQKLVGQIKDDEKSPKLVPN